MCIFLYYHTRDDIVHLTSFFDHQGFFSRALLYTICLFFVPVWWVCWSKNIYSNIWWFIHNHLYLFYFIFVESHFLIIRICSYLVLIYLLNITFQSSEYKEKIIHIFHSILHGDTVVSDNGIWIFLFFQFFRFSLKNCMNITHQYLHYFSFNNLQFLIPSSY